MYPHERSLVKKLSGKPFALLGINSDDNLETLRETIIEEQITWRSWWDEGRTDGPIQTTWQIQQRPTIHLLDAKGIIRYKNIQPEGLDEAIDKLIAEVQGKRD
jgi:hypothetical protein